MTEAATVLGGIEGGVVGEREGKVQMGFIITRSAGNLLCCVFVTQFWFPGQLVLCFLFCFLP